MTPTPGIKTVGTLTLDASVSNISTGAWTVITSSVVKAAISVEIFNSTGATLAISKGVPGSETAGLLPYTILIGGSSMIIPMDISSGKPLTVKSLDNAASSGILVLNLFG